MPRNENNTEMLEKLKRTEKLLTVTKADINLQSKQHLLTYIMQIAVT